MQGVEVNAVDSQKRTPLLLAASKGAWKTVHLLLESGADISLKDNKNRNFLHLAIKYGGKLNQFGVQSIKVCILTLKLSIVIQNYIPCHQRVRFFTLSYVYLETCRG